MWLQGITSTPLQIEHPPRTFEMSILNVIEQSILTFFSSLEELSISGSLFLKRPTLQDLHDLLTPMPRITVLNLTAIPTSLEIGEILDGVLNAVPNLQVLRLGFRSTIFDTNLHVQRFLHSKLRTLHLIYSDEEPTLDLTLPTPAPVNFTLEELVIKTWRGGRLFATISPFLPNLRSLALNNANDKDLQNIFQNHVSRQKY